MFNRKNTIAIIFDDHRMFADSFSSLIDRMGIFQSVRIFSEEKDIIQFFIKNVTQDIYFFVGYYLKGKHSLPLINDAKRLNKNVNIIVVSSVTDPLLIQNILFHNPEGFLSKFGGFSEILECIRSIENNIHYISPFITGLINEDDKTLLNPFTVREIELLQYFDQGYSISDTAEKVCLSKHTVVAHRRHMMEKSKCSSITKLLAFSRKKGIL